MPRAATLTRREYFGTPGVRVVVHREPRQPPMGQHRHEFFEIAVVLSGTAVHATGGFRHRIETGDVLCLDRRRAHGYEETRRLNLLNILVRDDALARIGRELADRPGFHALFGMESASWRRRGYDRRLRLSAGELEQIEEWASRIEETARPNRTAHGGGRRAGRLLEEAYLTLILDVLSRRYGRRALSGAAAGAPRQTTEARLGRLLSWIEANLARPLRVAELAERAGMSERTFHRAFRAATGLAPLAYVIRARLAWAAERLAQGPGETVTETALACGFNDGNHFSHAFRRFAGTSPTAWRRKKGAS